MQVVKRLLPLREARHDEADEQDDGREDLAPDTCTVALPNEIRRPSRSVTTMPSAILPTRALLRRRLHAVRSRGHTATKLMREYGRRSARTGHRPGWTCGRLPADVAHDRHHDVDDDPVDDVGDEPLPEPGVAPAAPGSTGWRTPETTGTSGAPQLRQTLSPFVVRGTTSWTEHPSTSPRAYSRHTVVGLGLPQTT